MIRINLAKTGKKSSPGSFQADDTGGVGDIQRQGAMRLLMILLIPCALYAYEFITIPDLQSQLSSKNKLLNALKEKNAAAQSAVDEIKKYNEERNRLQLQVTTLDQLRADRQTEVKILDNIQKEIPEKVWLSKLDMADAKISLTGFATADIELTSFMETLGRSVFLREVNLVRSTEQPSDKGLLKRFEISCAIDRARPSAGVNR